MRNRKVLRPPLLEKINLIENWMYKMIKNKRLIINSRQYNVTVLDKDPSSDKSQNNTINNKKQKK